MRRTLPRLAPRARCFAIVTVSLACLLAPMAGLAQDVPAPKPLPVAAADKDAGKENVADNNNADNNVEILTRGPLHEAFAEQVAKDPKPGIVSAKKPPVDVNEIPPEFKPEGDNVTWIPGYWFWDEERKDFIWISGVWRSIPPNRRWVPGYWQAADKGHQWVSGFWAPAAARELKYQDAPPESLDRGPTTAAPSEEHFWIPGGWNYADDDYRWRAGYWHPYQEDWAWVPEHYVWTPQGCVFVSGYWDYSLARRGQSYAPVYFHNDIYAQSGFRYRPSYLIGGAGLLLHLFVHPHHGHYYFGDYYGSHYAERNYYHAYAYHGHHRGYDPLYTYYRAHYRHHGIDYHSRMRGWNDHFTKHTDRRPPRTYAAQRQYLDRHKGRSGGRSDHLVLGRSTRDAVARPRSSERFRRVSSSAAGDANRAIRRSHDLSGQRRSSEGRRTSGSPTRTGSNSQVAGRGRLTLPPASTPAAVRGQSRGPRPADRSRDVVRSSDVRRSGSSPSSRSGSLGNDRSHSLSPSRASSARRYESRGGPTRSTTRGTSSRSSEAARDAARRFQQAHSHSSSRPSGNSSARPSTSRGPSASSSARPSTSRGPSGSSARSPRPSRTSPRSSSASRPSTRQPSTSRPSASRPSTSRPSTSRPSARQPSSSRVPTPSARPSRSSSNSRRSFTPSRTSPRPSSRAPSSGSRSSTRRSVSPSRSSPSRASSSRSPSSRSSGRPSASRPSRSSSGSARSSSGSRRSSPSRSSSRPSSSSSRSSRGKK